MMRFLLIFLLFSSVIQKVYAHASGQTPLSGRTASTPAAFHTPYGNSVSNAGYGYLSSSEAQASTSLNFSCETRDQDRYVASACHRDSETLSPSMRQTIAALFHHQILTQLRRTIYEKNSLDYWATSAGNGEFIPGPPSCINSQTDQSSPQHTLISAIRSGNSGAARAVNLPNGTSPNNSQVQDLRRILGTEGGNRATAVANTWSDNSLISGIVNAGYFNRALYCLCTQGGAVASHCSQIRTWQGAPAGQPFPNGSAQCESLYSNAYRVKESYPMLFDNPADFSTSLNERAVAALSAIQGVLGVTSLDDLQTGTNTALTAPFDLNTQIIARLETSSRAPALRQSLEDIRDNHRNNLYNAAAASDICSQSLDTLVAQNPTAVRQMLIDLDRPDSRDTRDLARMALCQTSQFTEGVRQRSCRNYLNVERQREGGNNWNRVTGSHLADYPFTGQANYRFRKFRDSSRQWAAEVRVKINFVVQPGATLDPALRQQWQSQVREWYNNQATANNRRVNFIIDFTQGPQNTSGEAHNIAFHECYCSTCSTDKTACGIPGRQNQADASNFASDVDLTTIIHEVGHTLGLADEYAANYYPFNRLGENDSIMNGNPPHPSPRLYNRHFNQFFDPDACF